MGSKVFVFNHILILFIYRSINGTAIPAETAFDLQRMDV